MWTFADTLVALISATKEFISLVRITSYFLLSDNLIMLAFVTELRNFPKIGPITLDFESLASPVCTVRVESD